MKRTLFLVCVVVVVSFTSLSSLAAGLPVNSPEKSRYPMLSECEKAGEKMLCGTLEVPEDYSVSNGRKIPISVTVAPTFREKPSDSVYLYHPGGPGGDLSFMYGFFSKNGPLGKIREFRDVLIMDFRGTGSSRLSCKAYDELEPYAYAFVFSASLLRECLDELKENADVTKYDTPNVVRDIESVRRWLGIRSLDFQGGSYGTRVAMEYFRRHPARVSSLILRSVVPPGFRYVEDIDSKIQQNLERVLEACGEDEICRKNHPDLGARLAELAADLEASPGKVRIGGREARIDAYTFRRIVGHVVMSGSQDQRLPLLIDQAAKGNLLPLIQADSDKLVIPTLLSAFCSEVIDRGQPISPKDKESVFTKGGVVQEKAEMCEIWPERERADWLDEPLNGKVPALVFSGEFDAQTPPENGKRAASFFENSAHIVFSGEGHSDFSNFQCHTGIVLQFIEKGSADGLDLSCATAAAERPRTPFYVYLAPEELSKYEGEFNSGEQKLKVFSRGGGLYMQDEYGESALNYLGENTFNLQFCESCRLKYDIVDGKTERLFRLYRQEEEFLPAKASR